MPDCDFQTCERVGQVQDVDIAIWILQIHLEFDHGMSREFAEMAAGSAEPDSMYDKLYVKLVEPPTRLLDRGEFWRKNKWIKYERVMFRPARKGKTTQRMKRWKFLEGVDFSPGPPAASFVLSGGD